MCQLMGQLADAETRISAARRDALAELEDSAVTVAQAAVERLAGAKVTKKSAQDALREVLGEPH